MAETVADGELPSVLKPFYQRASEAEDRLSRLEAALANKTGHTNAESEKSSSTVKDLESKIKILEAELVNERKKAGEELQKLKTENTKNQYRIGHLVRALKEADLQRGSK